MVSHHLQKLTRSFRPEHGGARIGDVPADQPIRLTVRLKPHQPMDPAMPVMSRADFRRRHGTRQQVVDRLSAYARGHGRTVEHAGAGAHIVRLSGTYAQAQSAFEPESIGV